MKKVRFAVIGVVCVILFFQIRHFSQEIIQLPSLFASSEKFFLLMALICISGSYISDGMLSKITLRILGYRISFLNTVRIAVVDVFAGQVLPFGEAGAVATSLYFYKKLGVSNENIALLSVVWGVLTSISMLILFIFSIPFLPLHTSFLSLGMQKSFAGGVALGIGSILVAGAVLYFLDRFLYEKSVLGRIKKYIRVKDFFIILKNQKNTFSQNYLLWILAIFFALLYFLTQVGMLYFSFLAFNLIVPVYVIIFCLAFSLILIWMSFVPGGVGVSEVSLSFLFLSFGLEPEKVFAGVLFYRMCSFWIPLVVGAASLHSLRRQWR